MASARQMTDFESYRGIEKQPQERERALTAPHTATDRICPRPQDLELLLVLHPMLSFSIHHL